MDTSWFEEIWETARVFVSNPARLSASAICMIVYVTAFCRVFSKAGFSPFLGLLAIPPLTFAAPIYLAFAKWPQKKG